MYPAYDIYPVYAAHHIHRYFYEQNSASGIPCVIHRYFYETNSATGIRIQVARVRAEYPNQLDYGGSDDCFRDLFVFEHAR